MTRLQRVIQKVLITISYVKFSLKVYGTVKIEPLTVESYGKQSYWNKVMNSVLVRQTLPPQHFSKWNNVVISVIDKEVINLLTIQTTESCNITL